MCFRLAHYILQTGAGVSMKQNLGYPSLIYLGGKIDCPGEPSSVSFLDISNILELLFASFQLAERVSLLQERMEE